MASGHSSSSRATAGDYAALALLVMIAAAVLVLSSCAPSLVPRRSDTSWRATLCAAVDSALPGTSCYGRPRGKNHR